MGSKLALYANTARHMKPSMIVRRLLPVRRISPSLALPSLPLVRRPGISIPALDQDPAYCARFDIDSLKQDEFFLINERHKVDLSTWSVSEAPPLWNFNLHYFEYCVPLGVRFAAQGDLSDYETFKRLVRSWIEANTYAEGDGWHPYTISLRLVNWLICMDLFWPALEDDREFLTILQESMYRQYRHLLLNQEKRLLANHYFENLKTLLICSWYFDDDEVAVRVSHDLSVQLAEQVLPDGMHYERSLMYHKLVLEGLLRIVSIGHSLGKEPPQSVAKSVQSMSDAMASLEKGMGKTPFFNDAADGVAKECGPLASACHDLLGITPDDGMLDFPSAGYYKLYEGGTSVMVDVGLPGPSYNLGHAHCDALSFELSVDGNPLVVNSGTYAYQGSKRASIRSTAAHNTVLVDGEEQLECWAEHRVARRYKAIRVLERGERSITAELKLNSGADVKRRIDLEGGRLSVKDHVEGDGHEALQSFVHLSPGADSQVSVTSSDAITRNSFNYFPQFGLSSMARCFVISGTGAVSFEIDVGDAAPLWSC